MKRTVYFLGWRPVSAQPASIERFCSPISKLKADQVYGLSEFQSAIIDRVRWRWRDDGIFAFELVFKSRFTSCVERFYELERLVLRDRDFANAMREDPWLGEIEKIVAPRRVGRRFRTQRLLADKDQFERAMLTVLSRIISSHVNRATGRTAGERSRLELLRLGNGSIEVEPTSADIIRKVAETIRDSTRRAVYLQGVSIDTTILGALPFDEAIAALRRVSTSDSSMSRPAVFELQRYRTTLVEQTHSLIPILRYRHLFSYMFGLKWPASFLFVAAALTTSLTVIVASWTPFPPTVAAAAGSLAALVAYLFLATQRWETTTNMLHEVVAELEYGPVLNAILAKIAGASHATSEDLKDQSATIVRSFLERVQDRRNLHLALVTGVVAILSAFLAFVPLAAKNEKSEIAAAPQTQIRQPVHQVEGPPI